MMITQRAGNTVRASDAAVLAHYYVVPNVGPYAGRARWVEVVSTETDAQKNTAIRTALSAPR